MAECIQRKAAAESSSLGYGGTSESFKDVPERKAHHVDQPGSRPI